MSVGQALDKRAMRILWLNASVLVPLDKGGRIRTWNLLRHLAARHEITYLTFAGGEEAEAARTGMGEVCARLVTVPRHESPKGSASFYAGVAARLIDPLPYAIAKYRSAGYRRAVDSLLEAGDFDRLVCDFLVPAVNLRRKPPCTSFLFTHNVEAEIWRRHAETAAGGARRWLFEQQWRRMARFEARTLARFDRVLAVSDADARTFRRLYGDGLAPASVVPTGVDTSYFSPSPAARVRPWHLVFVGSMDWMPNEDAVLFFCREVLPLIRQAQPQTTLTIVGRSPSASVTKLARDPGIEVTGRVDDVRPYLYEACVSIVPLRIGGGTRLKIFEAMSAGKAVVSTEIGAEGLPTDSGRHLLLADRPEEFAAAVLTLFGNQILRECLEHEARALVTRHFDWAAAARQLETFLLEPAARPVVVPSQGRESAAARAAS